MTSFKPTEDELFDYHLGLTDRTLTHQIEDYLTTHPQDLVTITEYKILEETFKKKYPLSSPSDLTLNRVQQMARKQLRRRFFDFLKIVPVRQQLAWVAVICLVVGLSFILRDIRNPAVHKGSNDTSAALQSVVAKDKDEASEPALNSSFDDYIHALSFMHQNRLPEACNLFSSIISKNPAFEKRSELYSFWIDSLNKMGDAEQAQVREEELKKILERQSTVNGQSTQ